ASAVVAGVAVSLALLVMAVRGTALAVRVPGGGWERPGAMRATWLAVSLAGMLGLAWAFGAPPPGLGDVTAFHNDAIAIDTCAARLLTQGRNPYANLDVFDCFEDLGIGADRTTPLRRGLFAALTAYPTDAEL